MESFRYTLDPSSRKFICPNCNKKRLVKYIDTDNGNYLADDFGKCDRKDQCAYHKAPPKGEKYYCIGFLELKEISDKAYKMVSENGIIEIVPKSQIMEIGSTSCWLSEWYLRKSKIAYLSSETKYFNSGGIAFVNIAKTIIEPIKKPSYHSWELQDSIIKKYDNQTNDCNLTKFLLSVFPFDEVQRATQDYYLTGTNHFWNNATVFWQIDKRERIHAAKIMLYNPDNGKRVKEPNCINWLHKAIKEPDFNLCQCLFGLHLVNEDYQKTIGIVESEKTAILMSMVMPDLIWLATGSKENLKPELLKPLKNRIVVLFPDNGGFQAWKAKTEQMEGYDISVSELLEGSDIIQGSDLADYYLKKKLN